MKKLFIALAVSILFLSGCGEKLMNTPTKKVEMFLDKYKTLDKDVTTQLDEVINNEGLFTDDDDKDTYRDIMKHHYQDLTYEIKEEKVNGNQAVVTAEVEVTDYSKIMSDANNYLSSHRDEFNDENNNYSESKFTKYRLEQLKNAKNKVKYTIDFQLTKKNNTWVLDDLTDEQEAKINGMYTY